ncbi:C2 family cysteine protease [Kribbella sp. NBC_01505]|uniref:C2 family cysteine protease n=1 Tax=Kribbella sp. NBC_01505 TaxID=2903580 RepID=UPI00386628AE
MTGYVSITPARVRLLVKALEDVGTASDGLRTRVRDLIHQGTEAGGSPGPLLRETMPFGSGASGELRGLAADTRESSQGYTRRVTRFEAMMKAAQEGKPAPDPQTWFNDMGPVDKAKVDAALKEMRGVLDDWMLLSGDDIKKVMDKLNGLTPAELEAVLGELSDDELKAFLDRMKDGGALDGGLDEKGERDLLNLFGSKVSLPVIQRMCRVSEWAGDYFRPSLKDTGANAGGYKWDPITGTLFAQGEGEAGGADMTDVDQLAIGDCGLQATLAALAKQNPGLLEKMVTANANGSYTVTFYEDGKPVQIVVQPEVLRKADGTPITGFGDRPDGTSPEMWAVIVEKAAAQWRGGYANIEGRWPGDWMEEFTGKDSERTDADDVGSTGDIQAKLDEGKAVTFSTKSPKDNPGMNDMKPKPLYGPHAYTVIGTDGDYVLLQNPWGSGEGVTRVHIDELRKYGTKVEAVDVR